MFAKKALRARSLRRLASANFVRRAGAGAAVAAAAANLRAASPDMHILQNGVESTALSPDTRVLENGSIISTLQVVENGSKSKTISPIQVVENGVEFRTLSPADAQEVTALCAEIFHFGEPTTAKAGISLEEQTRFCKLFVDQMASESVSVVARDAESKELLGVILNEDFATPIPDGWEEFERTAKGKWGPLLGMVGELEDFLMGKYEIPKSVEHRLQGQWLHLWMLGVSPAARGRSVAQGLTRLSMDNAANLGYKLAFGEATGAISTHVCLKLGCEAEHFIDYNEWNGHEDAEELIRDLPAEGHPGMTLVVKHLNTPQGVPVQQS